MCVCAKGQFGGGGGGGGNSSFPDFLSDFPFPIPPYLPSTIQFNYQEFILSWKQSVPEGMKTSLEYLKVTTQRQRH